VVGRKKNHTVLILAVNPKFASICVLARPWQFTFDAHLFENQPKVLPARLLCVLEDDAFRTIYVGVEERMTFTIGIADELE